MMNDRLSVIRVAWVRLLVLAVALGTSACSIDISPRLPPSNNNSGSGGVDDTVIVTFRNLADDEVVDVEFYFAQGVLENLPDDLFVEENRFPGGASLPGQGIGSGNQGTIGPREVDALSLPCDGELILGTAGGTFLDAETGDEQGRGTAIWLQQQEGLFTCGTVIEFIYEPDGAGFTTTLSLN